MKKTDLSAYDPATIPDGSPYTIGIIAAEWNQDVTDSMLDGAVSTLTEHGVKAENIIIRRVPGTFELSTAADMMLMSSKPDAVICIGCVVQGETRHFDFICQAVAQGITNVGLKHDRPVIFSVLTCNTMQQALERAGGQHGNKGVEGAVAALKMIAFQHSL